MQLEKPRARIIDNEAVLVHGMGLKRYASGTDAIDKALRHWYQAAIKKVANAHTTVSPK